jgi:hypothetical protein
MITSFQVCYAEAVGAALIHSHDPTSMIIEDIYDRSNHQRHRCINSMQLMPLQLLKRDMKDISPQGSQCNPTGASFFILSVFFDDCSLKRYWLCSNTSDKETLQRGIRALSSMQQQNLSTSRRMRDTFIIDDGFETNDENERIKSTFARRYWTRKAHLTELPASKTGSRFCPNETWTRNDEAVYNEWCKPWEGEDEIIEVLEAFRGRLRSEDTTLGAATTLYVIDVGYSIACY